MAYQVLARKYRPQKFSDVIGQEHVTRTLQNAIAQQRIAHGYIFSGHRGIGKTTIARILAMALNCRSSEKPVAEPCGICDSCQEIRAGSSVDVIEIDAATNRGIDEIRELRDAARYRPARDRYKIYILDEAHQITDAAFNALLKTLEEPPPHIVFMMATTQPEDIPQTIRSRCQHFSFQAVRFEEITNQLRDIAKQEKIDAEEDALAALAEAGDGSMRDALSIMDQAIACCAVFDGASGAKLTAKQVRDLMGTVSSEVLVQAMACVHRNSSEDLLKLLDRLMTEGQSPSHFAKQLVRFLRNAVVAKVAGDDSPLLQISSDERKKVASIAALFSEEDLTRFLNITLRIHEELGYKQEQRFHLELGMLKMVHAHRLLPLEEILSQAGGTGLTPSAPGVRTSTVATSPKPGEQRAPALSASRSASASPFPPSPTSSPSRTQVSPFEADRLRKVRSSEPEMSVQASASVFAGAPQFMSAPAAAVSFSSAATAVVEAPEELPPAAGPEPVSVEALRSALIGVLEAQSQDTAADLLARGEWKFEGNQLSLRLPLSEKVIDLSLSVDARRLLTQEASRLCGRMIKLNVFGGATAQSASVGRVGSGNGIANGTGGARQRAAEDPIVQRMQQKFGAEVRTVVDLRQKK
ncbi:MAG TPA: DNA polymerase III subunit gamma/tau [Terriglobales bacterium]|nr:DNA polymerase III subunit gamma/tau [Terriglobales bacterium]